MGLLAWIAACKSLDPGSDKTHHAFLSAYRSWVITTARQLSFSTIRPAAPAHTRTFLYNWRRHLMVDDYATYKAMFADGPTELA
ncbi:MAG: IS66 family transposase [Pseudomonadota bacterium]|nr:IS66 family transposase [Pseudomonadota bacterium]